MIKVQMKAYFLFTSLRFPFRGRSKYLDTLVDIDGWANVT